MTEEEWQRQARLEGKRTDKWRRHPFFMRHKYGPFYFLHPIYFLDYLDRIANFLYHNRDGIIFFLVGVALFLLISAAMIFFGLA